MTREEIAETLRPIFAAVLKLPLEEVGPGLSPETCESWDSLQHIHLMSAIDETFGISLDIERQIEILNFDLGVEVVHEALREANALSA